MPREVVRHHFELPAEFSRHRSSVVAEPLVERSLEPLTAVSVREQPVYPGAEVPSQRPTVPASGLMSSASHVAGAWGGIIPDAVSHRYEVVWQAFEGRRRPRAIKRVAARLALWRAGGAG
jgi:hypothetical protein